MNLVWRRFIAWSPPVLVMLLISLKWWFPVPIVILLVISSLSAAFGILLLIWRKWKYRQVEMAGAFSRALASLAATETSLSLPLLLTAIALTGSLGNAVESGNVPLLINTLLLLIFTTFMVLLLEPITSPIQSQEKSPPRTSGLVIFLSRKPPSDEGIKRWQKLKEETQKLGQNSLPTWDDLKQLSEVIRNRRSKGKDASLPTRWVELLADTPLAPSFYAIAYHLPNLKHLWVVVTQQTEEDELGLFKEICDILEAKFEIHQLKLENPDNLIAIQQIVNTAYHQAKDLGLPESEVTTDITGGSALMSVGGVLACVRSQRRVQYLSQTKYELQEVPVGVENISEAIQEFLEQITQLMAKSQQRRRRMEKCFLPLS